ncbi:bifunctional adenosylcobinamide kinase/adenosylcobinamide-phosphate guanylyltransferase [bacterium]|nr:bifunctional adenosylcobinamide kinase/adenosylcobinamide-phosphate guanylyltransferase [bacterium]
MNDRKLVVIGGGVRSGKSAFALETARRLGERRAFLATARALDSEMSERIEAHRRERGTVFETLEVPLELEGALARLRGVDVAVVDCLTLWLSNLLLEGETPARIGERVSGLTQALSRRDFHCVIVTNEVGMGVVPESALGRTFRDVAGRAHQALAREADEIHFAVLGGMLRLRPAPVVFETKGELPCCSMRP